MTAARINCPECGGSGLRMGTYGDIECHDCGGEASWEAEPEKCDCGEPLDEGECQICDFVMRELRATIEMQRRVA